MSSALAKRLNKTIEVYTKSCNKQCDASGEYAKARVKLEEERRDMSRKLMEDVQKHKSIPVKEISDRIAKNKKKLEVNARKIAAVNKYNECARHKCLKPLQDVLQAYKAILEDELKTDQTIQMRLDQLNELLKADAGADMINDLLFRMAYSKYNLMF